MLFLALPTLLVIPLYILVGLISALVGYHFYLQIQFPGEVRTHWSWIPFLGFALQLGERPVEFLRELAQNGDEIVGVVVAGQRIFFIMDAFSAPLVFKSNPDYGQEVFHNQVLTGFFGCSDYMIKNHALDGDLMRKWYVQYLLG